jgi:hypothetical protein
MDLRVASMSEGRYAGGGLRYVRRYIVGSAPV